jgi:hypothetical protein
VSATSARRLVAKDVRALAPAWGATIAALGAEYVVRDYRDLALPTYLIGAATLGAMAIGHEYSHRTLGQLLAQPTRRTPVLLLKWLVLAVMLIIVAGMAWIAGLRDFPGTVASEKLAALILPAVLAFTVAPWLSMVSRTALGGAVLSMALPGFLWTAIMLAYLRFYGDPPLTFTLAVFWRGGLTLAVAGAVMTGLMFQRLEVSDGPVAEVRLPSFGAAAGARRGSPLVRLIWKDLYLQQMPIVIAFLYCLAWPLFVGLGGHYLEVFHVLSMFFPVTIALLAGSLSSAEERQLGTLDTQTLLPVAASTQWTIKAAVALALTLVVGIGLPWVCMTVVPLTTTPPPAMLVERSYVLVMIGVLAASLYVSSLTASGIRAAVVTVPILIAFVAFIGYLSSWIRFLRAPSSADAPLIVSYALVVGFFAMLLLFAFRNHRSADRNADRVAVQALSIAAFGVAFAIEIATFATRLPFFIR